MTKIIKNNKNYFTSEVDEAIVQYCSSNDYKFKNEIYNKKIKKAFEKLAENIINNWKTPYINESFKNKKAELVSHLLLNLDKFDIKKGKAFSYFTYAAKNYLIINNDFNYKKIKTKYNINIENDTDDDECYNNLNEIKDLTYEVNEIIEDKKIFISLLVKFFDKNIIKIFKKKKDIKIAYAILEIISNYEYIENFNKKNIYILIKEITDESVHSITKVLNIYKNIYNYLLQEYNKTGDISMKYNKNLFNKNK